MPRLAKELGALAVKKLKDEGYHAVGGVSGLYLAIGQSGAKSWILRTKIGNRRSDIGLGSYPSISLSKAHEKATETKENIRKGVDPIAEKKLRRSTIEWTFQRCSEEYIKLHRDGWKSAKHIQQWENTLETYANPVMGSMHVRDIGIGQVLAVIEPHWLTKNETMVRVRNRIELVLGWAAVRGYRSKENPAAWRGNLDSTLPKPSKVNKREAHKALPFIQINAFMKELRQTQGMSAKCLEWLILTASRSNEARGARWSEIDIKSATWIISASRMKGGREHRVPLSESALTLLKFMPRFEGSDYVFQGQSDMPLSDMAMTLQMRRMKVDAVPHGFRSTFVDWASECTSFPVELREMALAHKIPNATQAAYQRGDLFERRRELMHDWAIFVEKSQVVESTHKSDLKHQALVTAFIKYINRKKLGRPTSAFTVVEFEMAKAAHIKHKGAPKNERDVLRYIYDLMAAADQVQRSTGSREKYIKNLASRLSEDRKKNHEMSCRDSFICQPCRRI